MDENMANKNIPDNHSRIKALHTYEGDMARAIRENNGSIVKISLAEQKKNGDEIRRQKIAKARSRNFFYVISTILIIIVVFFSARFVIEAIKERGVNKSTIESKNTFFAVEEQTVIESNLLIGKESSIKAILATLKAKAVENGINIVLFKKESLDTESPVTFLSTQEFINRLQFSMPGALTRSLSKDMLIGSYTQKNNDPKLFILWETTDYDQSFAGMLEWENGLFADIFLFFDETLNKNYEYFVSKKWEDLLIDNNDARVLRDIEGNPVLYYIFLDRSVFLLANDLPTIREITSRLRTENLKK